MSSIAFYGLSGNPLANGVLSGVRWLSPALTFSFPTSALAYHPAYGPELWSFGALSAQAQSSVRQIFNQIQSVSGLTFTEETTNPGTAILRLAVSEAAGSTAYAYYPDNYFLGAGGDAWFSRTTAFQPYIYDTPQIGNYAYFTYIHEIGHALGLKHGHEAASLGAGFPTFPALPAAFDSMEYSVMSYRSYAGMPIDWGYGNEQWGYAQSLMMADIAALQEMYGPNYSVNSGPTVYSFSPTTGEFFINGVSQGVPGANRVFRTIWDGGGVDTYDFSNYSTNQIIDLAPGGHSLMSSAQRAYLGDGNFARGNVYNALLFRDDPRSLIENANGGSGNDIIYANQANNALNGNAGNDTLYGYDGDDVLNGGSGADIMFGGKGSDTYYVDNASDQAREFAGEGTSDRVFASVNYALGPGDEIEHLYANAGAVGLILTGNELANRIVGNSGPDTLNGGAGDDTLDGKGGADIMNGGPGNDTFIVDNAGDTIIELPGHGSRDRLFASVNYTLAETSDVEQMYANAGSTGLVLTGNSQANSIYGNAGSDTLNGGAGDDTLDGKGGADIMNGGPGNDTFYVDHVDDQTNEMSGEGSADRVFASVNYALGPGDEIEFLYANAGNIGLVLTGNELANRIYGNAGSDTLNGGAGDDMLDGKGGADIMFGGPGNDTFYVDHVNDQVKESAGEGSADRIYASVNYTLGAGEEVEFLYASAGTVGLVLTGNELANRIVGGAGQDTLNGGGGDDTLDGKGGADIMNGGVGNDTFIVDHVNDQVIESVGEGSADRVFASVNYTLATGAEIEFLYANAGANGLTLTGNEFNNRIYGGAGADTLLGGAGNDVLYGGAGNDRMVGGAGIDVLVGQAGNDTFVLQHLQIDRDYFNDFNPQDDQIEVSALGFGDPTLAIGGLTGLQFIANDNGLATNGGDGSTRFIYNTTNGYLYFDPDGTNPAPRALVAMLTGAPALTINDFNVVA